LTAFFVRLVSRDILLAKDLNNDLGTDNGTQGTPITVGICCSLDYALRRTPIGGDRLGREIAAFVGFFGYDDATLRAYCNTEAAAFASFSINNNFASHFRIWTLLSRFVT